VLSRGRGARGACVGAVTGSSSKRPTRALHHRSNSQPQGSTRLFPIAARATHRSARRLLRSQTDSDLGVGNVHRARLLPDTTGRGTLVSDDLDHPFGSRAGEAQLLHAFCSSLELVAAQATQQKCSEIAKLPLVPVAMARHGPRAPAKATIRVARVRVRRLPVAVEFRPSGQ